MTAAAIRGTFSDFKSVKTRSVVQIIVEIPIEQADNALRVLGGFPQSQEERWVAVARLDPGKVAEAKNGADNSQKAAEEDEKEPDPPRPHRNWHELKLSNQAGIAGDDPRFWAFLEEAHGYRVADGAFLEDSAEAVRDLCAVQSRAEFDTDEEAGKRWTDLYGEFQAWKAMG